MPSPCCRLFSCCCESFWYFSIYSRFVRFSNYWCLWEQWISICWSRWRGVPLQISTKGSIVGKSIIIILTCIVHIHRLILRFHFNTVIFFAVLLSTVGLCVVSIAINIFKIFFVLYFVIVPLCVLIMDLIMSHQQSPFLVQVSSWTSYPGHSWLFVLSCQNERFYFI